MSASEWSLTARWVFPVDAPPLERGIVVITGDRIAAVEPRGTRTADYDLGNAAILPGLVNAHTHLDLSGLLDKCPPTPDFINWLRSVITHRKTVSPEKTEGDIRIGIAECRHVGTTLLGDISVGGKSLNLLTAARMRSVVFYEVLGLPAKRADEAFDAASKWLRDNPATEQCRRGVSPHAPYSTHRGLYTGMAKLAAKVGVPVATHLAESQPELELLRRKSGPFADFLIQLGVWNPLGLASKPEHYITRCRQYTRDLLLVHCNYLSPRILIPPTSTIVYCPRTHAAFGHPAHPFREFLARGVRVALGTDSLASNPDLDVLAEARFVHAKHPDVGGDVLLRMATLSGAEALGWAAETGSLTPGKSADLVVLPLPNVEARDPHELVLESTTSVSGVLFRGNWTRRPEQLAG